MLLSISHDSFSNTEPKASLPWNLLPDQSFLLFHVHKLFCVVRQLCPRAECPYPIHWIVSAYNTYKGLILIKDVDVRWPDDLDSLREN